MIQMKIKLFATLREGRGKEVFLVHYDGITPKKIIDSLGIPEEEVAILLINGRDGSMEYPLLVEDYLSIFPPVGGG